MGLGRGVEEHATEMKLETVSFRTPDLMPSVCVCVCVCMCVCKNVCIASVYASIDSDYNTIHSS